jgi:hypothetical protein
MTTKTKTINMTKGSTGKAATPAPMAVAPMATAKPAQKLTHSYRLFALLKKQKGVATTEELAAAAGLKPFYVSWYMAEMKRVYGVDYEHKRGDKYYRTPNLQGIEVPPTGLTGKRRNTLTPAATTEGTLARKMTADQLMAHAIDAAEGAARAALDKEFARLRASLAKVKVQEAAGEVRVASIPWDVWQQMKREQAARVQPTVN